MKKALLIITIALASVLVVGCCATHYTPVPSAVIQKPPKLSPVKAQVWIVTDQKTGKAIKYLVIPEGQLFILKANILKDNAFIQQCFDLIGEK